MTRLLVCGGRNWANKIRTYAVLGNLYRERGIDVVIEGDARGADRMAGDWARKNGIDNLKFPARWEEHGAEAGPIRNRQMLKEGNPNLVLAFPGGRGTAHMVKIAREAGIEVIEVEGAPNLVAARDGDIERAAPS